MNDDAPATVRTRIDAALAARRHRPAETIIQVLAHAAARWAVDPRLDALAAAARLSPPMIHTIACHVREAMRPAALSSLLAAEPSDPSVRLVGHVLASNVPALALPAIAHACLAGAAVVVKSGRADRLSAPLFQQAVAAIDPELAATIVPVYWPGGDPACEAAAFERADVIVGTGDETTIAALTTRLGPGVVTHGDRTSAIVVTQAALADLDQVAARIAYDVALYDQRGCLSPHAVFVASADGPRLAHLAAAILRHLDELAVRLPLGPAEPTERAGIRQACEDAEWSAGATVTRSAGGIVVQDPRRMFLPAIGGRTLRIQPLDRLNDLPTILPRGRIESLGVAGDIAALLPALRQ